MEKRSITENDRLFNHLKALYPIDILIISYLLIGAVVIPHFDVGELKPTSRRKFPILG